MNTTITSLIFLLILFAIYYVDYHSNNPTVQIKVTNLNVL